MTTSTEEFKDTEEDTSRMEMAAAIAELEAKEPAKEEPAKEPVKEEAKEPAKEPVKEEVKEPAKEPVKEELAKEPENQLLVQDKAPVGWSPKMREQWGTIPQDVRSEILRREEASVQGVRQLQEQHAPANQFVNHLMPFIKEAADNNINPAQYIHNIMESERRLRQGTDNERFGALVEIAEGYGIPLKAILTEVLGKDALPQAAPKQTLPPEIQRELQEARAFRQQYEQKQAQPQEDPPQIKEFAKTHAYFEDLREEMATLAEAGFSNDLQALYDEAVWRNPGVREVVMAKQGSESALSEKQKNALNTKVKSSNPTEMKNSTEHDDDDSLEDTIRKSIMAAEGRV